MRDKWPEQSRLIIRDKGPAETMHITNETRIISSKDRTCTGLKNRGPMVVYY